MRKQAGTFVINFGYKFGHTFHSKFCNSAEVETQLYCMK